SFALDEPSGVEHERRIRASIFMYCPTSRSRVINAVADNAHAVARSGTILCDQVALASRQSNNSIRRADHVFLGVPLCEAFGRPLPKFILGLIQRVNLIDEGHAGLFLYGARDGPEPENVKMHDVRPPALHDPHARLDG